MNFRFKETNRIKREAEKKKKKKKEKKKEKKYEEEIIKHGKKKKKYIYIYEWMSKVWYRFGQR